MRLHCGILHLFAVVGALAAPGPELIDSNPPPPPHEINLSWDAPAGCPSAAEVEARYRSLLSGPPVGDGTLVADAKIRQETPGLWVLRLTTSYAGASHTRVLEASACVELADGVAMVFAVALEPGLSDASEYSVPDPTPAATPEPQPPPLVPRTRPGRATRERTPAPAPLPPVRDTPAEPHKRSSIAAPTPFARLTLGAERGALPGVAALPALSLGLLWPRAQLEADISWLAPRSFDAPVDDTDEETFGIQSQSVQGAVRGCYVLQDGALRIPVCFGWEAGRTFARSQGLLQDTTLRGPWLAAGARAALSYRWRRVGVYAAGEVLRSLVTTRLRVVQTPLFTPSALSVRGIVGLEFFFFPPRP